MTFRLGLTGSIGMGKSTTAAMFVAEGCALWDADACVHRLYGKGGAAVGPIGAAFPEAVIDGAVSRDALRRVIAQTPEALARIEEIVHPLVRADRADFAAAHPRKVCVFDIPLLFETGAQDEMDAVACVTVSPQEQRKRVLARKTMSAGQFEAILARQMPNDEKCRRADYVIETDKLDHARARVREVMEDIRKRLADA